jgi:A/G-specific adenine glycosylase
MAALPGSDWTDEPEQAGPLIGRVSHVFTHFRLELAIVGRSEAIAGGWWQPLDQLENAGLPTLYCRAVETVLAIRTKLAA